MPFKLPTASQVLALLVSGGAYAGLAYATPRADFGQLLGLFAVALLAYAWLLRSRLPVRWGLGAALVFRLLWVPAAPALSDDVYRFHWDGLLVAHGSNPFRFRPDELLADSARTALPDAAQRAVVLPQLRRLYGSLNSPRYYSVYPPVGQAAFGAAARWFPASDAGFSAGLRIIILLAELATAALLLALLRTFGAPARHALRYLLHPLVIVELTGNLHFEGVVLGFVLLMVALLARGRWRGAAVALGLGVGTKLVPLLALPLLLRRLGGRRFVAFAAIVGGVFGLLFAPFLSADLLVHIGNSLALYFRNFEFNASVYYLVRALGYWLSGYNQIALLGPTLALLAGLLGLGLAWRERRLSVAALPGTLLLMLTAYYALATTVHPWYLTVLIGLGSLTRFRFAQVWGGLAVLSYAAYRTSAYTESPWLLALEYAVVYAVLAWEIRAGRGAPEPAAA